MCFFFFQAEDGIRDVAVTGVQTCALPIYRELSASQSMDNRTFHASGCLQHNQSQLDRAQPLDQRQNRSLLVGDRLSGTRRAQGDVEPRFRNVDANKDGGNFHDQILLFSRCLQYSSALQMMRAWLAQATVRAFAEAGRDDPCSRTASHDQGNNGLSRPVWF